MKQSAYRMSRHMWLMVLCCLIPMAAFAAIFVFKVPVSQTLAYGLILICPLSHVVMMAFMGAHQHADRAGSSSDHEAGTRTEI